MRSLFLAAPLFLSALAYEVEFIGLDDPAAMKALMDHSDLVTLKERPPASINGIRYRIAGDMPQMMEVLHAYGYYEAKIESDLQGKQEQVEVTILIEPGPQYKIGSYQVFRGIDCNELAGPFPIESLGLKLGAPAYSVTLVNAELNLLMELSRLGYPLASVEKRKVIVDMQTKKVEAAACIDEGPLSKFGPTTIFGLKKVDPAFVLKRIDWCEGEFYNPDQLQETQKRLLNSNLFSSVLISHAQELDDQGALPIKLRLSESKHRQITFGVFYATVDGPGGTFNWTHRNVRGLGETVSLDGEFSKRYLAGKLTYKKPDFWGLDQTLRLLGAIEREDINPYVAFTYRGATFFDKIIDAKSNFSIGLDLQHINVAQSASNGTYLLLDVPILAKYNSTDDPLNPTKGSTIVYQPHFFQSLEYGNQHFIKQRLTTTFYLPIYRKAIVFAGRLQFGSIAGARQRNVPLPILFLGGSEDDLRGYRYMTVSPLNQDHQPKGGRSAVFLTAETRLRLTESVGVVPFADFGTVTLGEMPTFNAKWYKSVGGGLRIFTFFGPLRFDIGFPLDRRKIDPAFRIYASIGQTF